MRNKSLNLQDALEQSTGYTNMADILSIDDFHRLSNFIYRKIGIRFEPNKLYFVSKRVEIRVKALELDSPRAYVRYLLLSDDTGEFQKLANLLTVNETYFFREFPQLEAFAEHCLPKVVERKLAAHDHTLRIWSAGCSTGEEPYTLSIILREMLDDIRSWDVEIVASDLDLNVLRRAREGLYNRRSVKDVPQDYLDQYFTRITPESWQVTDEVKKLVHFEHFNLANSETMATKRAFDFIFCRNVLIYFDDVSRKRVVENFYFALNRGGYIFLGTSESIGRITTVFTLQRLDNHLVYCKD